jgi:hypothetical protein
MVMGMVKVIFVLVKMYWMKSMPMNVDYYYHVTMVHVISHLQL